MQETGTVQITVAGKNVQVTPALREHAERKVTKMKRYFDDDQRRPLVAEVVLAMERDRHQAEITLKVGSLLVRGVGKTDDMYVSIDTAVDRLERQVRKYKTRIQKRLQDSPKLGRVSLNAKVPSGEQTGEAEPRIVRVKRFAFKPMTVEEAVLQMELLGHDFFVFTDGANDEINVLYRRRDGNYGLIEPEF